MKYPQSTIQKTLDTATFSDTIIKVIASFIEHNIITKEYYAKSIHPLVQALYKTFDVEETCKLAWHYIIYEERDLEISLLLALAESKSHDSFCNPPTYESPNYQ